MAKRFFIKTLGCKVNQYESQIMREALSSSGSEESFREDSADVFVVNTCAVTHRADAESRRFVRYCHRKNPRSKIIVTGCCVETDAEAYSRLPGVSEVIRNRDKARIARIVSRAEKNGPRPRVPESITGFEGHAKAFVKVQDGCANRCSYCCVPLVRGPLKSRQTEDIVREADALIKNGFKELVLTGICLGAWGIDLSKGPALIEVLRALEAIPGDHRIRLSSIEPGYITDELIGYIATHKRLCRHLHIPLQSGDDEILRRMNRPYTVADFMSVVRTARKKIPGIGVSTDVIVGFPGESDRHFANSVTLIREMLPVRAHIFPFSRRKGTAAYQYRDAVTSSVITERSRTLCEVAGETSYRFRERFIKRSLDVLVESRRSGTTALLEGYTDNYIHVELDGPDHFLGEIVRVSVDRVTPEKTICSLLNSGPRG